MTENCRKKMAISFVLTLPDPKVGSENSFPFSRMLAPVICSRRSCMASTCLLVATRSPETFSPAVFFPENVKTGMFPSLYGIPFSARNSELVPPQCLPLAVPLAAAGACRPIRLAPRLIISCSSS